jgi:hypothetical protein
MQVFPLDHLVREIEGGNLVKFSNLNKDDDKMIKAIGDFKDTRNEYDVPFWHIKLYLDLHSDFSSFVANYANSHQKAWNKTSLLFVLISIYKIQQSIIEDM